MVSLVDDNQLANDSSDEAEATPGVSDLIKAVKDMGLESGSPNVVDGYETPWEHEIRLNFEAKAVFRSGNARRRGNDGGRCISEDPELIKVHSPERAAPNQFPSTQSTPSRPRKPELRTVDIATDPHQAFLKSPINDIPLGLDRSLQFDLSRILAQPRDHTSGVVYICDVQYELRRTSGTRVIKIGFTSDINKRMKAHFNTCAHTRLRLITFQPGSKLKSDNYKQILNCYQVERLIHTTLRKFKYEKKCGCGRNHKEFFEIGEHELDNMLHTVEHWVSWSERNFGHI